MNTILAKLIALKDRVENIQKTYNTVPEDIFASLRDPFLKDVSELKAEFTDLQDFKPQDYEKFRTGHNTYYKWSTRTLIIDIEYFISFLKNLELIQTPNIKISEEGIYFAGQNFDALLKFNSIISKATKEIIIVDNYLNEKILELIASKNKNVNCRILTLEKSITPTLKTFIEAFDKQHNNLLVKTSTVFHDRFIIIDKSDFYHFGASIKDAGNKGFMYSKIEEGFIKTRLLQEIESELSRSK